MKNRRKITMKSGLLIIILLFQFLTFNDLFSVEKKYRIVEIQRLFFFNIINRIDKLIVLVEMASDYEKRQEVLFSSVNYNPNYYLDDNKNKLARIQLLNLKNKTIIISAYEKIKIFGYDFSKIRYDENMEFDKDSRKYLDSKNINLNIANSEIIAEKINSDNTVDLVKKLYDYVIDNVSYKLRGDEWNGLMTYMNKEGQCIDYSDYFVSLCRSKKIPARTVTGFVAENGEGKMGHAWSEVYIKGYGWIPFDLTFDDSGNYTKFNKLYNAYLYYNIGNLKTMVYDFSGAKNSNIEFKFNFKIKILE
jgi:hypothetical protein